MPCTAAQRRPQRTPRLHTKRRASLWSAARASGSLAMRKSLCRNWMSASGIRTSGLCRSDPIEIRLAFLWYIVKRGKEAWGHELAWSCVVRLDHAEEQGVPLPDKDEDAAPPTLLYKPKNYADVYLGYIHSR